MSWTVACFCGTVYHAPLERCPTCDTPLPDVRSTDPIDTATHDAGWMLPHDVSAAAMVFGSLALPLVPLTVLDLPARHAR